VGGRVYELEALKVNSLRTNSYEIVQGGGEGASSFSKSDLYKASL
jgi:hypothetical protein